MYDLLIFDLDGTLVDSIGDITDAVNETLATRGVGPLPEEKVVKMVGAGASELLSRALDVARHPERAPWVPELVTTYRESYRAHPTRRTGLYLGVRETLEALRGVPKAVATNKPGVLARRIVEELKIAEHFEAVLGEDDVGRRKPDPLIVDLIRGKAGASRKRTLYVGDSLVDADTADAARVDLALVTYGYADPAAIRARPARFHLARFGELVRALASPSAQA